MSAAGSDAAASESSADARFGRLGMIARWRPVHRGHAAVLAAMCEHARHALIGIGSANRYNFRNPFTCNETSDMLRLALAGWDNFELIPVPDLDDGPRWRAQVVELFGPLDVFCSDNPYVASLLAADYPIIRPVELIPPRASIDGAVAAKWRVGTAGPTSCRWRSRIISARRWAIPPRVWVANPGVGDHYAIGMSLRGAVFAPKQSQPSSDCFGPYTRPAYDSHCEGDSPKQSQPCDCFGPNDGPRNDSHRRAQAAGASGTRND